MAQYDVDLRDYWRILKKRKAIVILMICLVGLSSYGFAKLKEPIPLYQASASVKIERATSLANLFLGAIWREGDNIVTQAFIIKSFPVLVQTAKEARLLPPLLSDDEVRNSRTYLAAVERLKDMVQAEQEKGTNIVNISVTSSDRQEAALIANAAAKAYRDYNIQEKNRQTFETKAFIETQLELTSRQLQDAEEELRVFKEDFSLVDLGAQSSHIINRLADVETSYEKVRREKAALNAHFASLQQAVESFQGGRDIVLSAPSDPRLQALSSKLSDLILKKKTLLFDYTEMHPTVLEVSDQIRNLLDEIKRGLDANVKTLEIHEAELYQELLRLRRENLSIPEKALQLERLQREVALQQNLYSQLKTRYQEVLIQESGKIEEVIIVRPALVPTTPINIPSKVMIIVTGIFMGLVIGIVFTFVVETLDTSIGTIEDVENLLGVPVLGLIPVLGADERDLKYVTKNGIERGGSRFLITDYDPKSLVSEAFRSLRANLQFAGKEKKGKSFLVTSSFVQEGKTFNVVNIALSMAQAGEKVLLVETDLRKPVLHLTFGLPREPGMTDYVLGNYNWEEVVNTISDVILGEFEIEDILKIRGLDNLHVITAGTSPLSAPEILRSERFREFLKEVRNKYDYIFFDAPPVMPVADAAEIAPVLDGVILVYKVGRIARGVLKRAKMTLEAVNAKIIGVVLNNVRPEVGPDYFKYQTQYYYDTPLQRDFEPAAHSAKTTLRVGEPLPAGKKYFRLLILLLAVALLLLGVFWKDIVAVL